MLSYYLPVGCWLGRLASVDRRSFFLPNCSVAFVLAGFVLALSGCGGSSGGATESHRSHLYRLGVVYQMYVRQNHRQPPADEKTLRDFIATLSENQRNKLQTGDIDAFFKSPRTGDPYVILYGDQARQNRNGVIAYEQQENPEGKRWLATSLGDVGAVDEAEFQRLTAVKKNKR